jgi:N-acetyl-gamma-glutamyl-phosphate reductase
MDKAMIEVRIVGGTRHSGVAMLRSRATPSQWTLQRVTSRKEGGMPASQPGPTLCGPAGVAFSGASKLRFGRSSIRA